MLNVEKCNHKVFEHPPCVSRDVSMAKRLYYRIGGKTDFLAEPTSLAEVRDVMCWAHQNKLPVAVVGAGTNVLFSDHVFPGVIFSLERFASWHWLTNDVLYVEAGVTNTEIASIAKERGKSQVAWMHRLPGQIGATVRMNGRCFGGEISQVAESVLCLSPQGHLRLYDSHAIFRGYKETTIMDSGDIVLAVFLRLTEAAAPDLIEAEMLNCERERERRHHFDLPSCGSTFKNNYDVGIPSGRIFEELGFKGKQCGGAQVSEHHANFIFNVNNATAGDVLSLAAEMRDAAKKSKQAELDLEVETIGSFPLDLLNACGLTKSSAPDPADASLRWRGLAWNPQADEPTPQFPFQLFRVPFLHYFRTPGKGIPGVISELLQLKPLEEARARPHESFLRWTTHATARALTEFNLKPNAEPGVFLDQLWEFSVSELFLAHPKESHYFEFEITPQGQWIAIALSGRRKRAPGHETPSEDLWQGVRKFVGKYSFGMEISYAQIQSLIADNSLRIQCCLSLGGDQYFLAPHWKNEKFEPDSTWDNGNTPQVKADFHQPHRFWPITLLG